MKSSDYLFYRKTFFDLKNVDALEHNMQHEYKADLRFVNFMWLRITQPSKR